MSKNLNQRVLSGSVWLIVLEVSNQLFQFFKTFYSAKFFSPQEFGVVGLALLILGSIDTLSTLGLKEALIQKRDDISLYLSTVWTIESLKGLIILILFILFYFFPIFSIGSFDKYRAIVLFIAITFFVQSCTNPAVLYMDKDIRFDKFFIYSISATVADVISTCVLIVIIKSIWALLFGILLGNIIKLLLSFTMFPFKPRVSIDINRFKELFRFGKWIFLNRLFGFLSYQIDSFTIATFFSLNQLGLYQMSNRIGNIPMNQASNVIGRIIFPTFSKVHFNAKLLKRCFVSFLKDINIIIIPSLVLTILYLPQIVVYIIGEKWVDVIPFTRVLLLAGLCRIYLSLIDSYFTAIGSPKISGRLQFLRMFVFLFCVVPLAYYAKVMGVSIAFFLSIFLVTIYFTAKALRSINIGLRHYLSTFLLPMVIGGLFLFIYLFITYYKIIDSFTDLLVVCGIQYIMFFIYILFGHFKNRIKFKL